MNKQKIEKAIETVIDLKNKHWETDTYTVLNDTILPMLYQQLNNGWIPVSEPPTEYGTYIVAWMPTGHTADDIMKATKSKATHYYEMLEYDPGEDDGWEEIKQYDSYKILAWRNLPEPYKEESE